MNKTQRFLVALTAWVTAISLIVLVFSFTAFVIVLLCFGFALGVVEVAFLIVHTVVWVLGEP